MLILAESEQASMIMSSESSVVPGGPQDLGPACMAPVSCHDYPHSPPVAHHLQQPGAPCPPQPSQSTHQHHQWDINDSALPVPSMHDGFELWPSGHCRRVYRGDSDDARRHVSGWAMRNTNNHNALILKKSCLGVLVCSLDCLLDSGRKVHLRPAICDKARRKQIGKPCPNPGCAGKLDLLSCRGHCGYPVTHFWRHVNNSVYFQAKGYHDHPRPEVKSLSEKGRHAFAKQLRQDGGRVISMPTKRRYPILTTEDIPDRKLFISAVDEVMCSCPPFECVCPKASPHASLMPQPFGYFKDSPPHTFMPHRSPPSAGPNMEPLPHGPFTQINITNTCLPPSSLDVSIPGFEIYKNCGKFAHHGHHYDNEPMMFRGSSSDIINTPSSYIQPHNRSPVNDLRSSQIPSCSNPVNLQTGCYSSRAFTNVSPCNNLNILSDNRDECAMLGQSVKSEPSENEVLANKSSSPVDCSRNFQSEAAYNTVLDFSAESMLSPRLSDYSSKYERQAEEAGKEQRHPSDHSEPTYITLTSPQRQSEDRHSLRQLHACRLGHITSRSPPVSENCLYSPTPIQPTRVDSIGPPPLQTSPDATQHPDQRELSAAPSSTPQPRRFSPNMPRLSLGECESPNTPGTPGRNSSFYPTLPSHHDAPVTPFPINNDFHMASFPHSTAPYGSSPNVPYGYYCSDVLPSASQQAYRNRSINITLTYN